MPQNNEDNDGIRLSVSADQLKAFARYELGMHDIRGTAADDEPVSLEMPEHYRITLDDLEAAAAVIRSRGDMDAQEFISDWLDPLFYLFYDALEIGQACGRVSQEDEAADSSALTEPLLPDTQSAVMELIISALEADMYQWYEIRSETVEETVSLKRIAKYISHYRENLELPVTERRYTGDVKRRFIRRLESEDVLDSADEDTKILGRRFIDELCGKGDTDALRIKGYACYGGNALFECDWKSSAKCMKKLLKRGCGYAANSLGYIYYYGRIDGDPDYRKAFKYFSIGITYGYYQSFYKISDMYANGLYVPKNIQLAYSIVARIYDENMAMLCSGDMKSSFADLAYRMGNFYMDGAAGSEDEDNYEAAYKYYLEAEFAIRQRMKAEDIYGDAVVLEHIEKGLEEAGQHLRLSKRSVECGRPDIIADFAEGIGYSRYRIKLDELKNDRCRITMKRLPLRGAKAYESLVTVPYISSCVLTDRLSVTATAVSDIWQDPEPDELIIDELQTEERAGEFLLTFLCGGKKAASLSARGFIYRRSGKKETEN